MVERASALEGHYQTGRFGRHGSTGITLELVRDLQLCQVAAWPDTLQQVADQLCTAIGAEAVPSPCQSIATASGSLLRIEPLKWWLVDVTAPVMDSEQGAIVDLSHSRCRIRVNGNEATTLLNRLLPLDLREKSFSVGAIASSAMHHIGVTLWRSEQGYELFLPRGFALSGWEVLFESAEQFGVEVV